MSGHRETGGDARIDSASSLESSPARRWILISLVVLIGLEFGLWVLGGFGRTRITVGDADLGWVHLPNQDAIDAEGVTMHINAYGYRDDDWAKPGPAEQSVVDGGRKGLRIAVLGDSVAFGFRMQAAERWPNQLHQALAVSAELQGCDLVTMNFAVPGYGLEQMEACYRLHAREWRPDIVIVDFHDAAIRPMLPIGRERLPLERWLARTAIADAWRTRVRRFGSEGQGAPRSVHESVVRAAVQAVLNDPFGPGTSELWARGRERLLALRDQVAADGGELVVLFTPLHRHFTAADVRRAAVHLAPILGEEGIRSVDLHGVFLEEMGVEAFFESDTAKASALEAWFLARDPEHLTVQAHDRTATVLADRLRAFELLRVESD